MLMHPRYVTQKAAERPQATFVSLLLTCWELSATAGLRGACAYSAPLPATWNASLKLSVSPVYSLQRRRHDIRHLADKGDIRPLSPDSQQTFSKPCAVALVAHPVLQVIVQCGHYGRLQYGTLRRLVMIQRGK